MLVSETNNGQELIVSVDSSLYSKDAIFKCLYWYTDKFSIDITNQVQGLFTIKFTSINSLTQEDKITFLNKINRDLIDFNLRDIVTKETKNIRDLLIAKAFSNGEFDEEPPGVLSDPVGFDITKIKNGCN